MTLATPPYHFGLVVENLERAQDEIGRGLGLTWAKTQRRTSRMQSATGVSSIDVSFTYSFEGPPYLELIERRQGSLFDRVGLHHIGVWTDDPPSESARLEAEGWPRESVNVTPEGEWAGALFHLGTCGLRVEVVNIGRSGPALMRYLGGGDYRI